MESLKVISVRAVAVNHRQSPSSASVIADDDGDTALLDILQFLTRLGQATIEQIDILAAQTGRVGLSAADLPKHFGPLRSGRLPAPFPEHLSHLTREKRFRRHLFVAFIEKNAIPTLVLIFGCAMPCPVTAFSVNIASPGDTAVELVIAREVIAEWNAGHALEQKRILLPLDRKSACGSAIGDILVAFFCDTPAPPGDSTWPGLEAEVEKHLNAGRPALVYFSEGRADLIGAQVLLDRDVNDFRSRCAAAVLDSYADEKELRAKFARQLDCTLGSDAHLKLGASIPDTPRASAAPPVERPLTTHARTILIEACDDFEAYIGRIKIGNTLKIQANGKQLVEQDGPASAEKGEAAFQELLGGGFIRDAGCNGQLFQISAKGFAFLKTIGKTPVGYIAELGGM